MTTIRKKKSSKHLVAIGTHVPMTTKLAVQAIAESQNISVYEYLQGIIQREVDAFDFEIDKLKTRKGKGTKVTPSADGEDLLA